MSGDERGVARSTLSAAAYSGGGAVLGAVAGMGAWLLGDGALGSYLVWPAVGALLGGIGGFFFGRKFVVWLVEMLTWL